jgi:Lipocalin-like domain
VSRLWPVLGLLVAGAGLGAGERSLAGIVGTWELVSRIALDSSGRVVTDSSLGADPLGLLVYDATGHVAVQLMSRRRTGAPCTVTAQSDTNNLAQVGGYDAYFGRYEVDPSTHTVTHHLEGALGPADVGRALTRQYRLSGDTLTLQFHPGGPHDARLRRLVWHRVSS